MYEEIPDLNLFMVCEVPKKEAFACLPEGYYFDSCRRNELDPVSYTHLTLPTKA